WKPQEEDLVDIMCGSGTLCLEAALIKGSIPPSFLKVRAALQGEKDIWAFESHLHFTKDKFLLENFQNLLKDVEKKTVAGLKLLKEHPKKIYGHDLDPQAIHLAHESF